MKKYKPQYFYETIIYLDYAFTSIMPIRGRQRVIIITIRESPKITFRMRLLRETYLATPLFFFIILQLSIITVTSYPHINCETLYVCLYLQIYLYLYVCFPNYGNLSSENSVSKKPICKNESVTAIMKRCNGTN